MSDLENKFVENLKKNRLKKIPKYFSDNKYYTLSTKFHQIHFLSKTLKKTIYF